jgi:cephalosporin hydroxylase
VASRSIPTLPPAVSLDLDATVCDYWRARCQQHWLDSYAGIPLAKFPEDLWVYEHLFWTFQPDTVIELGTAYGGSALWFRDRLRTIAAYGRIRQPHVISVDLDVRYAHYMLSSLDREYGREITLIAADVRDAALPGQIASLLREEARCLVVDDSAHTYEVTRSVLNGFAQFVPPGGFLVVEDGYVDIEPMRLSPGLPQGVLAAIDDWRSTEMGRQFHLRRDLEVYGLSSNQRGYLQRAAATGGDSDAT